MDDSQAEAVMAVLGPQLEWSARTEHSSFAPCSLLTFYRARGTFGNEYRIFGYGENEWWSVSSSPAGAETTVPKYASRHDEPSHPYKRLPDAKAVCERHNATGVWEQPTPFDKLMILGGEAFWNNMCGTACEVLETVGHCAQQINDKATLAHVQSIASRKALQIGNTIRPGDEPDTPSVNDDPDAADE